MESGTRADPEKSRARTPGVALLSSVDLDRWLWALGSYSIVAFLVCFWRLGSVGLIKMEGMIANGGQHMLEFGHWFVPRVYEEIYTYKPALAYWLAAMAYRISDPPSEWLLRSPSALSAFVMGLLVLLIIGRITGPRVALFCSLASISSVLLIQQVRVAEFDVILAAGVGVAVTAASFNLATSCARASIWFLAYLGLAFGFLAKGLPALMTFAPGLLTAALLTGRLRRLIDWRHLVAVLFFTVLAGGYLVAAYRSDGVAAFEQPLLEAKLRGFSWQTRQEGPVLSVLEEDGESNEADISASLLGAFLRSAAKPVYVCVGFLPWSLLLLFAFASGSTRGADPTMTRLVQSARAFLIAGVLVFMVTPTHEMRYYLPLGVPVGILSGLVLAGATGAKERRRVLVAGTTGAVLAAVAMTTVGIASQTPPVPQLNRIVLAGAGLLILSWIWLSRRSSGRERAAILMLLAVAALVATESMAVQVRRASKRDLRRQATELNRLLPDHEPIWVLGPADLAGKSSSLFHYLDRPIRTFKPGVRLPPPGSYCVLSSDRLTELPEPSELVFEELTRVRDPWRSYLLGRCSGLSDERVKQGLRE